MVVRDYGNGLFVDEGKLDKVADSIIKLIKKELPQEIQCSCIIKEVLSVADSKIDKIILKL